MEYAQINYSDLLLANGVCFLNPKLPSVIGGEGGNCRGDRAGSTSAKIGDRVTIPFGTFTWSEKVLAPGQGLFAVPPCCRNRPTRTRAENRGKVPNELMAEYYAQRPGLV